MDDWPALHTARLDGEPIAVAHRGVLAAWEADPRVGATMNGVRTAAESHATTARLAADWEREPFGLHLWRERATGAPVARGGIRVAQLEGARVVEVGWMVDPDRWGEGLATELALAAVAEGWTRFSLSQIHAWTLPSNAASRRVMEKLGMRYVRHAIYAGLEHVVSVLDNPGYTAAR